MMWTCRYFFSLPYFLFCFVDVESVNFTQVRDITSNPEWEKAYQYEIPVLAKVLSDGTEVCILNKACIFLLTLPP